MFRRSGNDGNKNWSNNDCQYDKALDNLSDNVGSLWVPQSTLPILQQPPDALVFLREFVSLSKPCILHNVFIQSDTTNDNNELFNLTLDDLVNNGNDIEVSVDATPDGHGDCIRTVAFFPQDNNKSIPSLGTKRTMFVKPEVRKMTLLQFRTILRQGCNQWHTHQKTKKGTEELDTEGRAVYPLLDSDSTYNDSGVTITSNEQTLPSKEEEEQQPVLYYSRQNDCLRTELYHFSSLILQTIDFAERAFGTGPPTAINLWIGDERSVSSMHKDPFENMYYVCSGRKVITLCPPADTPFLYEDEFDCGTFAFHTAADNKGGSGWSVKCDYNEKMDNQKEEDVSICRTQWIEPDIDHLLNTTIHHSSSSIVTKKYEETYPMLQRAHPIQITLSQGEMLYIPALWYHRVTQTCETVAINYWYEMRFDSPHWCYFDFLQHLSSTTSPK